MKKVVLLISAALAALAAMAGLRKAKQVRQPLEQPTRAARHRIVKLDEHELSAFHGN